MKLKGERIAVAMSGGVDSSVAAFLLKKAGADVFGITMKTICGSKCCAVEDIAMARLVAEDLGIKHVTVSLKKPFVEKVIHYFVKESLAGRNPNPCVPCNQFIKFGALLRAAEKLGAEYFATGHYARLEKKGKNIILKRPVDIKKDQSYVLSMLPRQTFSKVIFPIGDYTKEKVRAIAKKNKIRVFNKPENQDLCFLAGEKGAFVEKWTNKKLKPGEIKDIHGRVLGKHSGLAHYTIGQRHGLGLKGHERYYVREVDIKHNRLIVGTKEELFRKSFFVSGANWVSIKTPKKPFRARVVIRNKMEPKPVKIEPAGKRFKVIPDQPVWAVSPGQIAVFIKGDVVLGGGWIQ